MATEIKNKATSTTKSSSTAKKSTSTKSTNSKSSLNSSVSKSLSNATGIKKSTISKGLKKVNKLNTAGKIAVGLCFLLGVGAGYVGTRVIQKNDQFRLVNGETISINEGEVFQLNDLSKYVKCVSYGRNVISSVSYSWEKEQYDPNNTEEGKVYTLVFTSSDVKYKNIKLVQTLYVTNVENSYVG